MNTPTDIGSASDWAQYGFAGLLTFAVLTILIGFGWFFVSRVKAIDDARQKSDDARQEFLSKLMERTDEERKNHREEIKELHLLHIKQLEAVVVKASTSVDSNTAALHDIERCIGRLECMTKRAV